MFDLLLIFVYNFGYITQRKESNNMKLPVKYTDTPPNERRLIREEYIKLQNGKCHYCDSPLKGKPSAAVQSKSIKTKLFPEHFFKWPIHLHHDHDTDLTIGAVHAKCNAVLWQYHGE